MRHQTEIQMEFADGRYAFGLNIKQILELEEKCGAGIAAIHARLWNGLYTANDVVETIRLGLVGGGMDPVRAMKLVDRYGMPIKHSFPIARVIIGGVMWGFDGVHGNVQTPPSGTPASSLEQTTQQALEPLDIDDIPFGNWPLH